MSLCDWKTSPDYRTCLPSLTPSKFFEITDLLFERPNLNSSHLFRADILQDSAGILQTVFERGSLQQNGKDNGPSPGTDIGSSGDVVTKSDHRETLFHDLPVDPVESQDGAPLIEYPTISGFKIQRSVIRRLIPRKPQVDRPMKQTCLIYTNDEEHQKDKSSVLVMYIPDAATEEDIPWYHPKIKSMAYHYSHSEDGGSISIHFKPFPQSGGDTSDRLHRTMLSLVQTFARLAKMETPSTNPTSSQPVLPSSRTVTASALRDTILPQHTSQNTYTRLKQTYASDLIARWTESTDPAKHVFEDISIAAFLIELWKTMYEKDAFPGFVDIACGNGVLVYILIKEGYTGRGFDARRRKTWDVLDIDENLEERLCIPKPFLDSLPYAQVHDSVGTLNINDGIFTPGTFIISNHADELTLWTPILAALSCPGTTLPFLAIPCCSHALSGSKHRYTLKDVDAGIHGTPNDHISSKDDQPATGDLKALRSQKVRAASHSDDKSQYACLTKKTIALAEELGIHVEPTLMRIPSTRNIGVVGNRLRQKTVDPGGTMGRVQRLLERECAATGGLQASAETWTTRAKKHVEGQGRGKVNLGKKSQ